MESLEEALFNEGDLDKKAEPTDKFGIIISRKAPEQRPDITSNWENTGLYNIDLKDASFSIDRRHRES